MIKRLREQLLDNQRAFYATLVCVCTLTINLTYYLIYNTNPLTMFAVLPIIFWIAYDGNEHEKAALEGYWVWVILLIITTFILVVYPLF
jgi:hypothetical protein